MKSKLNSKMYLGAMVLIMAFIQFSCKTRYELGVIKAKPMSDSKLYRHMLDSSLHYETLFIKKFSANYSVDGVKKSFKGAIKIQKDSLIWITITAPIGGLEVARLMISQDSVKMINRMKKTYFVDDYDFFRDHLNVDLNFESLQAIITNSVFQATNNDKEKSFIRGFNGRIVDNMYVFTSEKSRKVDRKLRKDKLRKLSRFGYQRIQIDPALMRITDVLVKDFDDSRDVNVKYRDFKMFEDRKFPQRLSFEVADPKHLLYCSVKFNKIAFDEKLKFSFKISSKYERIYP
ncbi:DUF4292 domain-containing protein [Marinifilum sp.]|uniref:DUF4292 domain-containing protein n=1 Tax=Marinifilum sp. TaxID=2033137 RepID=UPI003BAD9FBD